MGNLLFTIITPAYNAKESICRCVKSVVNQQEDDYEFILIDDGSTDGTTDGLDKLLNGKNYRIEHVKNGGVSKARNIGLELAQGRYIIFLDSDDELAEGCLKKLKIEIERDEGADIYFLGFKKIYPKREKTELLDKNNYRLECKDNVKEFEPYAARLIGTVWGKCYKKSIILDEKFNNDLIYCEDAEFNYRVFSKARNFIYLNIIGYKYYYSLSSVVRTYNSQSIKKYCEVVQIIYNTYKTEKERKSVDELCAAILNVICFNNIYSSNNKDSLKQKNQTIKNVCENTVFKDVLKNINMSNIPFKHKISVKMMKKKRYIGILGLVVINKIINKVSY